MAYIITLLVRFLTRHLQKKVRGLKVLALDCCVCVKRYCYYSSTDDACSPNPCENDGNCTRVSNKQGFTCNCSSEYTRDACKNKIGERDGPLPGWLSPPFQNKSSCKKFLLRMSLISLMNVRQTARTAQFKFSADILIKNVSVPFWLHIRVIGAKWTESLIYLNVSPGGHLRSWISVCYFFLIRFSPLR